MYSLNSSLYGSVFVVPSGIVEKYIKLASFCAVKTLLWILKNQSGDFSLSDIAKGVGSSEADVREAVDFWLNEGVLIENGKPLGNAAPTTSDSYLLGDKKDEKPAAEIKPVQITQELTLPTYEQVVTRMNEDKSIADLINHVQVMLGRSTGYDMNARLVQMIDGYGFPVEIILRLIQYCIDQNKTSNAFILSVAKSWYKNEITTLEQADLYINEHTDANRYYYEFKMLTGLDAPKATPSQEEYFIKWSKLGIPVDMAVLAYNITIENTGKIRFAYMDKILCDWHSKGYKNAEEAENARREQKNAAAKQTGRSYDIEKAIAEAQSDDLVYEKKKKSRKRGD